MVPKAMPEGGVTKEKFHKPGESASTVVGKKRVVGRTVMKCLTRGVLMEAELLRLGLRMEPGIDQQKSDFIDQLAAKYRKASEEA